ncbi:MAG: hypothetical protein M1834_001899 [Cirrosporium novae-zelandiae]|nr:MAG: hypothetical protein M1834_001899 [Cirrosporium novae-zelandiae]
MNVVDIAQRVIQDVYKVTIFIKEIVTNIMSYDVDIQGKLDQEIFFLESFDSFFFKKGTLVNEDKVADFVKKDVLDILNALYDTLGKYERVASRHGILHANLGRHGDTIKEQGVLVQSRLISEFNDLRRGIIDWTLFDKKTIFKTLAIYSEWTTRLRQTISFVLLAFVARGDGRLQSFADSLEAGGLGVRDVIKRQILATKKPSEHFRARWGQLVDNSVVPKDSIYIARYQDEWKSPIKEVVVEYRPYNLKLCQMVKSEGTDFLKSIKNLKDPIRDLAWHLQVSDFAKKGTKTTAVASEQLDISYLQCMGYLDEPTKSRFVFLYELPQLRPGKAELKTLHDFINDTQPYPSMKPALGSRFLLAHRLATAVFNTHSFGWLHRNIWSRGIIIFPGDESSRSLDSIPPSQPIIPYLLGWDTARSSEPNMELPVDLEVEQNFYRHPRQQGKPRFEFMKEHDIYALGVVLLEIGIWRTVSSFCRNQIRIASGKGILPLERTTSWYLDYVKTTLTAEMGRAYSDAVSLCLTGKFGVDNDDDQKTILSLVFREKVIEVMAKGLKL